MPCKWVVEQHWDSGACGSMLNSIGTPGACGSMLNSIGTPVVESKMAIP